MASSSPPSDLITQVDPATAFLPASRPVKKPSTTKRKAKQADAEKPNPVAEDPAPAAGGEPEAAPTESQAAAENPAGGAAAPALSASAPTGDTTTTLPVAEPTKSEEAAKSPHAAKSANDTPKPARTSQKPLTTTSKQKPDVPAPGTPTKLKAKKGFWAALFGALLCTSDSNMDGLHEAAIDQKAPAVDESSDSGSAAAHLKEKEQKPVVHDVEPSQTTVVAGPPSLTKEVEQSRSTEQTVHPVLPVDAPSKSPFSPSPDTQIIVPPSPKHTLPMSETEGVMSGSVQAPGSTGEEEESTDGSGFTDEEDHKDAEMEDEDERLILNGGVGIPIGPDGQPRPLLPPVSAAHAGRKCLVLDLDETLLHSSFRLIPQADYVIPVEIEWQWHNVYVIKRPGVDNFLKKMGELYEVVVFTASLSKYADPVLDKLDVHKVVTHRLFRESCYNHKGNYVKDLSQLGRPMTGTIILDNSPASYIFHPNNAVPVSSWFNDPHDTELTDLCPFLADLRDVDDVRGVLDGGL